MPARRPKVISDAKEAIFSAGGVNFVAKLFGVGPNAVRNWYRRGLPPQTYSRLAPLLRQRGCVFTDDLFRQYPVTLKQKSASLKKSRRPRRKLKRKKRR